MISTPPPPAPPPSHPNELYTLRCRFRCSLWWCQITPPATFPTTVRSGISLCFIGVLTGSCQSSFFFFLFSRGHLALAKDCTFFSKPSCSHQRLCTCFSRPSCSHQDSVLFSRGHLARTRDCTFFSRPSCSHQDSVHRRGNLYSHSTSLSIFRIATPSRPCPHTPELTGCFHCEF